MIKQEIWVCEECNKIFTKREKIQGCEEGKWGHKCKAHPRSKKDYRCESYLEEFIPKESNNGKT